MTTNSNPPPLTGATAPIQIVRLRWARDHEKRSPDRWHREGFAVTATGTEIHFCGAYHPGECKGECGLPRLVRHRNGRPEAARVAMGICAAYCPDVARSEWTGDVIEVEQEGDPTWR